eukprot:7391536-Prymnesium_polylepis.3
MAHRAASRCLRPRPPRPRPPRPLPPDWCPPRALQPRRHPCLHPHPLSHPRPLIPHACPCHARRHASRLRRRPNHQTRCRTADDGRCIRMLAR